MDQIKKNIMYWSKYDVSNWVSGLAREREIIECGDIFVKNNIDGQKLWDYHNYYLLKDLGIPTVGLKLTLGKQIETLCNDIHQ